MRSRWILLVAVALAAVVVAKFVLWPDKHDPHGGALPSAGSEPANRAGETLRADGTAARSRTGAAPAGAEGEGDTLRPVREPLSPALIARRDQMMETIDNMSVALAKEREIEETETDEEEKIREEAWSRMVDEIKGQVRSIPAMADSLYDQIDEVESDAMAIRMARMLRSAEHPEFVDRLRTDAVDAKESRRRRMAVAALEMRNAEVFLEPVAAAFATDSDPTVRDEAAGVLQRSMMDRKHIRSHVQMRETLQSELTADDPVDRGRAVRALMGDTRAGPNELDRIRALKNDPDATVRREVERALRVLTPRVERAIKRK